MKRVYAFSMIGINLLLTSFLLFSMDEQSSADSKREKSLSIHNTCGRAIKFSYACSKTHEVVAKEIRSKKESDPQSPIAITPSTGYLTIEISEFEKKLKMVKDFTYPLVFTFNENKNVIEVKQNEKLIVTIEKNDSSNNPIKK